MKRFIACGVLVAVLALSYGGIKSVAAETWNVVASNQSFSVNDMTVEANALNINGSNYIKAAEFAELLDIYITFDEAANTVMFDKTRTYSGDKISTQPIGSFASTRAERIGESTTKASSDSTRVFSASTESRGGLFDYPPVKVNLSSADGIEHWVELSYQIAIPIQEPEISADYERFIETNAEVIKDIVTSALQETKYEAIIGTGFMDKFSGDMIKEINTALNTDIVKDFYITHLVMQ